MPRMETTTVLEVCLAVGTQLCFWKR
uniref:Uncharacterized protein n=1 Tax=Anguilla anguilla TaxID=7936 RepID=A0A0E9S229_ANGAN